MIRAKDIIESMIQLNERNILNIEHLENWLGYIGNWTEHPEVDRWIQTPLRSYMLNNYPATVVGFNSENVDKYAVPSWVPAAVKRGDTIYEINFVNQGFRQFEKRVRSIIDLMNSVYPSREFDKLVKTPMSDDLLRHVETRIPQIKRKTGIEETSIKYPDGFRWVSLKTFETIEHEGELMGNCLKEDTEDYARKVADGKIELYSLRDRANKPRVDVEIEIKKYVNQIVGYEDDPIKREYRSYCFDLIERLNLKIDKSKLFTFVNGVFENGKIRDAEEGSDVNEIWRMMFCFDEGVNIDFPTPQKIEEFLRKGVDIDQQVGDGKNSEAGSALLEVCLYAVEDTVGAGLAALTLLRHGADTDGSYSSESMGAFESAIASHMDPGVIKEFIKRGVSIENRLKHDSSPLESAISRHNVPAAWVLIESGARYNQDQIRRLIESAKGKGSRWFRSSRDVDDYVSELENLLKK